MLVSTIDIGGQLLHIMKSSISTPPPFIHPLAIVEAKHVGGGTRIWGWSHIQEDVLIGEYCNIGEHCFLENGVRIGNRVVVKNGISLWEGIKVEDDAFLGPHAVFSNERYPRVGCQKTFEAILVGQGASIGAGAVITPGVIIGRFATVGAGSVVTHDVVDHSLVFGQPAKVRGWMCVCGLKLLENNDAKELYCTCGRIYIVTNYKLKMIQIKPQSN